MCSTRCSSRLVQPWPSWRRPCTRAASSGGAESAASRRSGPCDLAKLRTCTVRSGACRADADRLGGGDRSGRVVLDDGGVPVLRERGELLGPPDAQRDPGGVLRPRLQVDRVHPAGRTQRVDRQALGVDRHADHLGAARLEQVEQRREARALDGDPVADVEQGPGDQVEAVHRPVDHREVVDRIGPVGAQQLAQLGHDRVVEVAGRRGRDRRAPQRRGEIGQQLGIGHAGGQLEAQRHRVVERLLGSAGCRDGGGRPPSCPAGRRCGSCPTGPAATRPRSPWSARGRGRRQRRGSAAAGRRGAATPSRTARLTAPARPRADGFGEPVPQLVQHFCNVAKDLLCGTESLLVSTV